MPVLPALLAPVVSSLLALAQPEPPIVLAARDAAECQRIGVCQLVDVRSRRRFARGHASEAYHIPPALLQARAGELRPELTLVVYGDEASDEEVTRFLADVQALGFTRVAELEGGFAAWYEEGLPVTFAEVSGNVTQW